MHECGICSWSEALAAINPNLTLQSSVTLFKRRPFSPSSPFSRLSQSTQHKSLKHHH